MRFLHIAAVECNQMSTCDRVRHPGEEFLSKRPFFFQNVCLCLYVYTSLTLFLTFLIILFIFCYCYCFFFLLYSVL